MVAANLERPEDIPHVLAATRPTYLNDQGHDTRVLEVPGQPTSPATGGATPSIRSRPG